MLFLILLSSLELCFDDVTVEPGSLKRQILYVFDIFFTVVFGLEVYNFGEVRRKDGWFNPDTKGAGPYLSFFSLLTGCHEDHSPGTCL